MIPTNYALSFCAIEINFRNDNEKNIPTTQHTQKKNTRFQNQNEDKKW